MKTDRQWEIMEVIIVLVLAVVIFSPTIFPLIIHLLGGGR